MQAVTRLMRAGLFAPKSASAVKHVGSVMTLRAHNYATKSFKRSDLQVEKTKNPTPKLPNDQLVFGKTFTSHMLSIEWHEKSGWAAPKIHPYGPLVLDPSCSVFHYAIECFEGTKAYKDKEGRVRMFRPMDNVNRLAISSTRLALPSFDKTELLECIKELVRVDSDYIPTGKGYSLYLRPTFIGTTPALGVHAARDALLYVIMCPVGPYYPTGFKPVSLYADEMHVRAWPGGTGAYKMGGNYAPGILPALEVAEKGYSQILWLLDDQVTEVGTMNMFVYWINEQGQKELITAPLDGTILTGVTRACILDLGRQWGEFKVTEAKFTMTQLARAIEEGRVIEAFGAGTAAIVSPIKAIHYRGKDYAVPLGKNGAGDLTMRLLDTIQSIQYGEVQHPWSLVI
jgi:branched-chain amino acid aminotransferase